MRDCNVQEIKLSIKDREIRLELLSPIDGHLADDPMMLMTFAGDRHTSLHMEPYCLAAELFVQQGHRVLSFDLPNHGERINEYGSEITGLRNAFIAECNPFDMFVEDASAAVDYCIGNGLAREGRIVASGTSRAGYLALRLLAADHRVCAAAAYSPVTDWRDLAEFAADTNRDDVAELRLSLHCDGLAGKPVFVGIGNHDRRVNTASCCKYYLDLLDHNVAQGFDGSNIDFYCTNDIDHTLDDFWRRLGGEFLLRRV